MSKRTIILSNRNNTWNNEKIVENGKTYLVEYELIEYFGLNQLPIKVYRMKLSGKK